MPPTYFPEIFDVRGPDEAKAVILTAEPGTTTDGRWESETPYLADLIGSRLTPGPESLILDYGCGMGRIAKVLIERTGCRVIGVDISSSMRDLAVAYVGSDRFTICPPDGLDALVAHGLRFDGALAVWVLQHCLQPREDITRIHRALKSGTRLFVVNNKISAIPTREAGWVNDGVDIKAILSERFGHREEGRLAAEHVSQRVAAFAFWGIYVRA